jgi:uncharacterized membrane protein YuzA (DUF378 family)
MNNALVVLALGLGCALLLIWGFLVLPRERWQILAVAPLEKEAGDSWRGLNLTWYGVLSATAYVVATTVFLALMGAVGVPVFLTATLTVGMLAVCVPASRLIALAVEKNAHTFTVGGASFTGLLLLYPLILVINKLVDGFSVATLPFVPSLAALAVAYAFGEGIGRLACISFGCCYGKALDHCSPPIRRLFQGRAFTFYGATRKAVYAGNLEGIPVLPIQAVTSVIYVTTGIAGFYLFLAHRFAAAALITLTVTQGWRVISEQFRADYRGEGSFSTYQIMALVGVAGAALMVALAPTATGLSVDITSSLTALWTPGMLLALQGLWLVIFLYTGRSSVTGAHLTFHVHPDRIV